MDNRGRLCCGIPPRDANARPGPSCPCTRQALDVGLAVLSASFYSDVLMSGALLTACSDCLLLSLPFIQPRVPPPKPPPFGLAHSGPLSICPVTPKPDTRQRETTPTPESLPALTLLARPHSFLPQKPGERLSFTSLPSFCLAADRSGASP